MEGKISMSTVFDIHLASDVMSPALEERLESMGFIREGFIGGIEGVVRRHHFSRRPKTRDLFVESWKQLSALLTSTSEKEFYGYAEAEVISPQNNYTITLKPFDPSVPFPFSRLRHEECPFSRCKTFDLHVTADLSTLNPDLRRLLEDEINFYYVDVRKKSGKCVRVYTFQPMATQESPNLYFKLLCDYFNKAGGMEGAVKLEATYAYTRFPETSPVPPIVRVLPPIVETRL